MTAPEGEVSVSDVDMNRNAERSLRDGGLLMSLDRRRKRT